MILGPKEYALGLALLGGAVGVAVIASKTAPVPTPPAPAPTNATQGGSTTAPTTPTTPKAPPTVSPNPPGVLPPPGPVTVTAVNSGQTIQLKVNQQLIIDLSATGDSYAISDSTGNMQPVSQNGQIETWLATKVGTDTITCVAQSSQQGSFVSNINVTFNTIIT
jgi:hypothetical protein